MKKIWVFMIIAVSFASYAGVLKTSSQPCAELQQLVADHGDSGLKVETSEGSWKVISDQARCPWALVKTLRKPVLVESSDSGGQLACHIGVRCELEGIGHPGGF